MPDFGAPVAQGVHVDPTQGIQTLSGLLGLKQQQLALQTGQYQKESAKAEAQTKDIAAQGQTEASGFLKNLDFFKHFGSDGTLDTNSVLQDPDFGKLSGPAKESAMNAVLGIKNNQIKNKQDLATLNGSVVAGASRLIGALAKDPDVMAGNEKGFAKTQAQWEVIKEMYPDQGAAFASKFQPHQTPENMKNPGDLASALRSVQMMGEDVAQQQAIQKPNLGTTYGQGGNLIGTAQDQMTGAVSTPQQPGVQVGLGPTDQPEYRARVASATTRATGVGGIDVDRATAVSSGIQPANAAVGLTQQVDDLAEQISSGKIAKWVVEKAAAAGVKDPAITARQLLDKDLGQLKTLASSRAQSDAKMDTILSGYPEATSTPETIHRAMDYIRGSFRQQLARGKLLNDYQKKHPDLSGFQHADDMLTSNVDPMMAEYKQLTTPEERIGFYKRNFKSAADAAAFKAKVQGLSHVLER